MGKGGVPQTWPCYSRPKEQKPQHLTPQSLRLCFLDAQLSTGLPTTKTDTAALSHLSSAVKKEETNGEEFHLLVTVPYDAIISVNSIALAVYDEVGIFLV